MSTDWLFCASIRAPGFVAPEPLCVGQFELTRRPELHAAWESAYVSSATTAGAVVNEDLLRARCFFLETSREDALESGLLYARELVALLPLMFSLSEFEFVRAGFLVNLGNGVAEPVPPARRRGPRNAGMLIVFDHIAGEPTLTLNSLLTTEPSVYGELGSTLRRTTHWQTVAKVAEDMSEELLALWMACEALSRENENESLTPKFLSALGLVRGRYLMQFDQQTRALFIGSAKITEWGKKLAALIDRMREARNSIAHAGYRGVDLPQFFDPAERRLVQIAMRLLLPRLQHLALAALRRRITTVAGMWNNFASVFREARQGYLINDAEGTVIYSFENPDGPGWL